MKTKITREEYEKTRKQIASQLGTLGGG